MHSSWQKSSQKAQGLVEFALVLPLLLLVILGVFAVGHLFFVYSATASASREAARYGSAVGISGSQGLLRFQDCQAIRSAAMRVGSYAGLREDQIIITYIDDDGNEIGRCNVNAVSITLADPNRDVALGDRIVIQVTTDYVPLVPVVDLPSYPISSHSARTILRNVDVGTAPVAINPNAPIKKNSQITVLTHTPDPSSLNQDVTIGVTVALNGSGSGTPTGDVDITTDGPESCTITLMGGQGDCEMAFTALGVRQITAQYNGDTDFAASTTAASHTVTNATKITLTTSSPTVDAFQALTITVSVEPDPPDPSLTSSPDGDVTVTLADGTPICTVAAKDTPKNCIYSFSSGGDRTINAVYPGDGIFGPSSASLVQHVKSNFFANLTVKPQTGTARVGEAVRVEFSLIPLAPANVAVGGSVTITDGSGNSCTGLVTDGFCMFTFKMAGDRTLLGTYGGDSNYNPATDNEVYRVSKGLLVITPNSNPDPSVAGQDVKFLWTITKPSPSSAAFNGNVTVTVNTLTGTKTCTAAGTAGFCWIKFDRPEQVTATYTYSNTDPNYTANPVTLNHLVDYNCSQSEAIIFDKHGNQDQVHVILPAQAADVKVKGIEYKWPKSPSDEDSFLQQIILNPTELTNKTPDFLVWDGTASTPNDFVSPPNFSVCAAGAGCTKVWTSQPVLTSENAYDLMFILSRGYIQPEIYTVKVILENDSCYAFSRPYQK